MILSNEQIEMLISMPKKVTKAPRKLPLDEFGHSRNDFELQSTDKVNHFRVFMRQNLDFQENFSIGLNLLGTDGSDTPLLRCNGPYGAHIELSASLPPHFTYHIHIATADSLENGTQPEIHAEETSAYGTFDDALAFFLNRCRIENAAVVFPNIAALIAGQKGLF